MSPLKSRVEEANEGKRSRDVVASTLGERPSAGGCECTTEACELPARWNAGKDHGEFATRNRQSLPWGSACQRGRDSTHDRVWREFCRRLACSFIGKVHLHACV